MRSVSAPAPGRVTVREVLAVGEFRAVLTSSALSILGDQVARIAVALLVFSRTGSALASSATYACSYLTWLIGGPLLSALADRHRRRRIMVTCDLLRAGLVATLLVPDVPLPLLFGVLVLVGVLAPPFDAAKGALLPQVLTGDRYLTGSAVINTVAQGGQVAGFLVGGALVTAVGVRGALAIDALSFLASGAALLVGVAGRAGAGSRSRSFVRDVREGFSLVAADPVLRRLLGYGLLGSIVMVTPEGLAVPVAARVGGGPFTTGVLTAAVPAGFLLGSWLVLRLAPQRRLDLVPALVGLSCVPLLLTPLAGSGPLVAVLWVLSGAGSASQLVVNAAYMTSSPEEARGRTYGIAVTSLMAVQGVVLLATGALSEVLDARATVAVAAAATLLLLPLAAAGRTRTPTPESSLS